MSEEHALEPGTPGLTPTLSTFCDAKGKLVKEVNGLGGIPTDELENVGVNNAGAPNMPLGGANAVLPYAANGFVCELAKGNAAEVGVAAGAAATPPMRSVPPDTPELVG